MPEYREIKTYFTVPGKQVSYAGPVRPEVHGNCRILGIIDCLEFSGIGSESILDICVNCNRGWIPKKMNFFKLISVTKK